MNDAKPDVASLPEVVRDLIGQLVSMAAITDADTARSIAERIEAALAKPASGDGLIDLIGEYWDLAYAEGKEGRTHDTGDGAAQRKLSEITAAIRRLATPEQPGSRVQGEVVAWLTDDGRVISGRQKEAAIRDGGASASSVKPYSIPCYTTPPPAPAAEQDDPEQQEWVISGRHDDEDSPPEARGVEGKVIEPCIDSRGHFWRPVDGRTSQCTRCYACANDDDFKATAIAAQQKEAANGD